MDPKITQDTAPVRWSLNQQQTKDFLAKLFPDDRLFPQSNDPDVSSTVPGTIETILSDMKRTRQRVRDRWEYFPDDGDEENIAQFFNRIIEHSRNSYLCTR